MKVLTMLQEGYTPPQVAAQLGISKQKLQSLLKHPENSELKEAYEAGMTALEAKFEVYGQDLMLGKLNGKEATWFRFMQKYFNWAEKREVDNKSSLSTLSDKEIDEYLTKELNKNN